MTRTAWTICALLFVGAGASLYFTVTCALAGEWVGVFGCVATGAFAGARALAMAVYGDEA